MAAGELVALADSVDDIDTTDQIMIFEAFQKACIVNGSNLKIADFSNTKLEYSSGLTTPPLKGDTLTQATSGASMLVDFVSADKKTIYGFRTTEDTFTTSTNVSSDDAGGDTMDPASWTPTGVTDRSSGPLWYDWTKHPSKSTAMPPKAYLGCLYRGRAVLSGNPNDPHQWYMSRQADIFDWDYVSNDAQTAVAGQNADAGKIGDIVRTLIPYRDDYLIFGCANSIHYLQGDPADGGTLNILTDSIGTFGSQSYCWDDKHNLWVFGTAGISVIQNPSAGISQPENISHKVLPKLIDDLGIDPSTHQVSMAFDKRRFGLLISIVTLSTGANNNYWFDLRASGFFPETYPNACGPYSMFYYNSNDPDYADLLVGCKDGRIRKFDNLAKDDDIGDTDQAIDSEVLMPVIPLGEDADHEGKITSTTFVTAGGGDNGEFEDTDRLDYEFHVADDPETVVEAVIAGDDAHTSGSLSGPGRQSRIRDRVRGAFAGIKIFNSTASSSWSLEKLFAIIKSVGRIK